MPMTKVFEGGCEYVQVLDKDGNIDPSLDPKLQNGVLRSMFESMLKMRMWDRKCIALQRTGRMYTYAPVEGQEAISAGLVQGADPSDWIFPSYRESFIYHLRGAPLSQVDLQWMGFEEGFKLDKKLRCFPFAIPVGSQYTHAVGAAYAMKMQEGSSAAIVMGGDGSTSEGDFHDGLNFAGVLEVPAVFIVSNNQYAISVPRKWQTRSETIAQKALAYGVLGVQGDGNDPLASYLLVREARERAVRGKGPTLIELVTYRIGMHTTADDPKKYRKEEEVAKWKELDPIKRLRAYLEGKGIWDADYEKELEERFSKEIDDAFKEAEAFRHDPKDMFRFLRAKMAKDTSEQMDECFGGGSS